jgi:hypothetical protein
MGEYFKPMRRTVGLMTLALALIFTKAFLQDLTTSVTYVTPEGTFQQNTYGDSCYTYSLITIPLTIISAWGLLTNPDSLR